MRIAESVARISASATMAAGERAQRLRAQGVDVIDLGPGQPDFPTPENVCRAGIDAIAAGKTGYTANAGIPELRQALARRFTGQWDVEYEAADVLVTCGGKAALYAAFAALVEPGDEVIIPTPYWVSFPEQVRLFGGRPIFVDTPQETGFVVRPEDVEEACTDRTVALVLNSPCNPSGAVIPRATLVRLAELAVERDVVVVYDETYEKLVYGDAAHASPLSLGPEARERTVVCSSFSKTYAMTGWRLGYALGPRKLIDAMSRLQSHMTSNATSISQWAALEALTGDQSRVEEMRRAFAERRELVLERLGALPGVRCAEPHGAFYAFPDVSELLSERLPTSDDLATYLIDEAHVVTVPGTAFGRDGFLRLSFAVAIERLAEAMDRLDAAVGELAG